MKLKYKLSLFVGAVVAGFALFSRSAQNPRILASTGRTNQGPAVNPIQALEAQPLARRNPQSTPAMPTPEKASLVEMAQTLSRYTVSGESLADLIAHLKELGQNPFLAKDKNPYTGEMTIVRTASPLVGTRYFHAQYFAGDEGEPFVQHMSFEFKPGPTAMNDAVSIVEQAFANLGQPTFQNDFYVQWNLGGDHIVWVKKLAATDLQDDPFNAYSAEDVGTIRVAVELEIHDRESGH